MENEISNEYIENAINELVKFFGVKEPVSSENIFSLIRNDKVKDAMKLIARQLDLPIDINITIVPNGYRSQNGANQFQSTHLVRISQHGSRGSEGITAQVSIPGNLPFYGSSTLNGYPINVKISENCTEHPVVFSMIMAHELSHVLLYSLMHPKKDNEFYTDLLAIMLGFQNIFQNGRKITTTEEIPEFMSTTIITTTTSYGYLTDEQFDFALNKINLILEKNKERKKLLLKKFKKFTKVLSEYEKTLYKFKKFLEYLTKNINKKITGEDGKKMVMFFQPGYMDEIHLPIKEYKQKQELVENFLKNLSHYTEQVANQLSTYTINLRTYIKELKNKILLLERDVIMLKKYISYKYRMKVFFFLLFNKMGKK